MSDNTALSALTEQMTHEGIRRLLNYQRRG